MIHVWSKFFGGRSPWACHIQKAQRVTTRPPKSLELVCTRPVYVGYHLSLLSNVSIWQLDSMIPKSVVIALATGVSSIRPGFPKGVQKRGKTLRSGEIRRRRIRHQRGMLRDVDLYKRHQINQSAPHSLLMECELPEPQL